MGRCCGCGVFAAHTPAQSYHIHTDKLKDRQSQTYKKSFHRRIYSWPYGSLNGLALHTDIEEKLLTVPALQTLKNSHLVFVADSWGKVTWDKYGF